MNIWRIKCLFDASRGARGGKCQSRSLSDALTAATNIQVHNNISLLLKQPTCFCYDIWSSTLCRRDPVQLGGWSRPAGPNREEVLQVLHCRSGRGTGDGIAEGQMGRGLIIQIRVMAVKGRGLCTDGNRLAMFKLLEARPLPVLIQITGVFVALRSPESG